VILSGCRRRSNFFALRSPYSITVGDGEQQRRNSGGPSVGRLVLPPFELFVRPAMVRGARAAPGAKR
jgi:hypothetical protein